MKILNFTLLTIILLFNTSMTNAQTGTLIDPFVIDMSTSPQTITNINTQNATETVAGANAPSCTGTIACCSVLVYKVILPTAGALFLETTNHTQNAGSIFGYTSAVATPTAWSDMTHFNAQGNNCSERDSMKLGLGYQRHGIPPYWFDEATFDDSPANVNYAVSAGDYYIAHWNYDQVTPAGAPTDLTFTFTPYCQTLQPEIEVEGNSLAIALGDNTPSTSDGTDFGTVIQGTLVSKTFTIKNVSANQLDILNVNITGDNAANFSVTASPSATVAGNSTTTFTVQFAPNTVGVNNATISIGNTDCDKYGYKFDVTAYGLGVAPSDKRGQMISLDGSNDYVEINSVAEKMVGVESFTLETWINADATQSGNDRIISVNKANGDNRFLFYLDDGVLETYTSSGNIYTNAALYTDLADDSWHHLAFTHNGSTNANSIYLDGQLVETETRAITGFLATDQWSIGQEFDGGSTGDFFKGKFDEVRIWKDVRTQEEIQLNKNISFTIAQIEALPNLVASYQFDADEATGIVNGVKDILGNHGTVKNGGIYNASEVAVGNGISEIQPIALSGVFNFNNVGVDFEFHIGSGENVPNGNIVVSKVTTEAPNTAATGKLANEPTTYWIINNYGTNTNLNADVTFKFDDGQIDDAVIGNHKMHKRGSNDFAAGDWTDLTPTSVGATAGNNHIKVNVTSFSQFSASSSTSDFVATSLPVEFISFNGYATNEGSHLTWQTATEKNNEGFEIQRSTNGKDWNNIGFVIGKGTTQETQNYEYIDEQPKDGVNYYRLKQVDFDGKFAHSNIATVNYESAQSKLRVFPNPVKNELNIVEGQGQATIYNMLGQPVKQFEVNSKQFTVNTVDLANGQYVLHIQQENGNVITKRFMK